jgi:hypothetical protein
MAHSTAQRSSAPRTSRANDNEINDLFINMTMKLAVRSAVIDGAYVLLLSADNGGVTFGV